MNEAGVGAYREQRRFDRMIFIHHSNGATGNALGSGMPGEWLRLNSRGLPAQAFRQGIIPCTSVSDWRFVPGQQRRD